MKIKGKIGFSGFSIFGVLLFIHLSIIMLITLIEKDSTFWICLALLIIIYLFVMTILFNSYILFKKDYMLISMGLIKQKVLYKDINYAQIIKNPFALEKTSNRIKIGIMKGFIIVSIKRKHEFFKELEKYVQGIEIVK